MGNISNVAMSGLLLMLCINVAILVMDQGLNMPVQVVTPSGTTDYYSNQFNSTAVVGAWSGFDSQFYDIGFAVFTLWSKIWVLAYGLPTLLASMGVPSALTGGIYAIWSFLIFIFVIAFIKGGDL